MLKFNLKDIKQNDCFVETGLLKGDGVQAALNTGYKRVISIEIRDVSCAKGRIRFAKEIEQGRVEIIHGSSDTKLFSAIGHIDEPITFWLDAHLGPKHIDTMTPQEKDFKQECPLYHELTQIATHHRNDHVIMIDDINQIMHERERCKWTQEVEMPTIEGLIKKINPDFTISLIHQKKVLLARCKT